MIEVYSKNVTVPETTAIPLNNVALLKGCTVMKSGTSSIQLQRAGVYEVNVSATAKLNATIAQSNSTTTSSDATTVQTTSSIVAIQLAKDNVLQPQAYSAVTASNITALHSLNFSTLVQVPTNNSECCCSSPVTLDVINQGESAIYDAIDVVVTKLC